MTVTRDQIVAEARSWVDTPFHHQGRVKGVGVDCAGVAVGVAKVLGMDYADVQGYSRIPSSRQFVATVEAATDKISFDALLPGDLCIFAFASEPQHIAVVTQVAPDVLMVHAWTSIGKCVENRMDDKWRGWLRGCYRFRGIE